jgi:hypothetical protein
MGHSPLPDAHRHGVNRAGRPRLTNRFVLRPRRRRNIDFDRMDLRA